MPHDDARQPGDGDPNEGPLSQAEIDALLAALAASTPSPAASPPPVSAPDPAAPAAEPPEAAGEPSPTAGEPAEATGSLDPALKRFSHLTLTLTASVGTATLTVRDWLNVGIGSRILLTSLRHQRVTIKLNGVPVGVGRVVLVNNTLGVEVEAWGARPGP